MTPAWRALLLFLAGWLPAVALVFFVVSGGLSSWSGRAVSFRPAPVEEPQVLQVLIVDDDGSSTETAWPADLVGSLGLPPNGLGIPPETIPDGRPLASKSTGNLHFVVQDGDGWRTVPTTSPRGLALALVLLLVGIGVRNMLWSGSPFRIERRELQLPRAQAASGVPQGPRGGPPRGRKGPPPPRRSRGRGRR